MAMKRSLLLLAAGLLGGGIAVQAQDFEDIYYNPKKDKTAKAEKTTPSLPNGYIIADTGAGSNYMEERDVDEYNRFGTYYNSPIDTIGSGIANSEDFRYTQQIQKYYNPTIVVDNSDVLADVLNDSYGNVNIIYANGYPSFDTWSYSPWYGGYFSPWYGLGPRWSIGWNTGWYDPWYGWYDPWYGPGWGWGWTWAPGHHHYPGWGGWYPSHGGNTSHRPSHRPTVGVNPGWSATSRPGIANGQHRPSTSRPSTNGIQGNHRVPVTTTRPQTTTRPTEDHLSDLELL